MNKILTTILAVALGGLFLGACGLIDDDIKSGKAFEPAFPDEDTLTIQISDLGEGESGLSTMSQPLVGDRADLHDLSFDVAWHVNFYARNLLETLWFITRFPPSVAVEEDGVMGDPGEEFEYNAHATWGPFRDDEGKNLEYILHAWRGIDPEDERTVFLYFIAGRPVDSGDEAWVPILVGGAKPFEDNQDRFGLVKLDMDAIRSLDPTEDDVGAITFVYIQSADAHIVAAVGEGVWADDEQTVVTDVTYFYGRSDEGFAVLEFETSTNMEDPPGDALETLHVSTGWIYTGYGRSDATVSGGDLGQASVNLTECWGADHIQDYFLFSSDGLEPDDVFVEDGNVSDCFTPEPLDLGEIDYESIRTAFD